MPLDTQAFLLRVLETGEFIRVGSSKVLKTDIRVIAATNIDLLERVRQHKFREDLYYRLNTVPIYVPPLRERQGDIFLLFRKFAADFAEKYRTTPIQMDEKAKTLLENYSWPGNIRELKNVAEQLSVLTEDRIITAEQLLQTVPNILQRHLPMIPEKNGSEHATTTFQEREILYKLLFEMKTDLNSLKSLISEVIFSNNLRVTDTQSLLALQPIATTHNPTVTTADYPRKGREMFSAATVNPNESSTIKPIIIENNPDPLFDNMEVVDENLSLSENEKALIRKALKKHHNKRKEAADDLGISERTLYRKIKEYDL